MKIRILAAAIGLLGMLAFGQGARAQSIAVGAPSLEDYLRRLQLIGKVDSASSFMIRPLLPSAAFGLAHGFDLDGDLVDLDSSSYHQRIGKQGKFLFLPALYKSQYTSTYPFATNDGAMIPNRGLQQVFSLGAFVEWWKLSLQLQPELVRAQNKEFIGFPIEQQSTILFYYEYLNRIDLPERFGESAYQKLVPGQSSFRLNLDAISLGVSTENLWWGPGRRNSLLMGNSAPGFLHYTMNTRRPISSAIGSFEGQVLTGRLKASNFLPPHSDYNFQQMDVYYPKKEDGDRQLSGMIVTYQPKWVPGLFFGYGSVNNVYRSEIADLEDVLPIFNGRKKNQQVLDTIQSKRQQFSAGFFRWIDPKGRFEFYGEFGTRDNDRPFIDFITTPESGRAFTFGFSHLMDLKKENRFLELSSEMTFSGQTIREDIRQLRTWYLHDHVRHGYTHRGQPLGLGNGPASNQIFAGIAWIEGMKKIGIELERIEYNNDFYYFRYEEVKDFRNKYVDLVFSLAPEWKFGNVLVSGKFQYVNTLNYKWYLENKPEKWFIPGYDRTNFVGQLGLTYLFR
jgi:hypothetical protein|uniref:capsule assembly Wzi family protein n=1 Tax=Algoriphagus sp. TaxID=1872435 RepID=UPI0040488BD7